MFPHRHYVPVLRWKGSEQKALLKMASEIRRDITPLLEIVPKQLEGGKRIERAAKQIADHWGWTELVFVDFHLLPNEVTANSTIRFSKAAAGYSIPFALSTGLRRSPTYQKSVRESIRATRCQLCLRLFKHDFRQAGLESSIEAFVSGMGVRALDVHLVLDFQAMGEDPPNISLWIDRLPKRTEWRTLTAVCCAFPKNLAHLEKNSQYVIPRSDLSCWNEHVQEATGRIAAFGDYTIQHGVFEETEGKHFNFSASLRYAGLTHWI